MFYVSIPLFHLKIERTYVHVTVALNNDCLTTHMHSVREGDYNQLFYFTLSLIYSLDIIFQRGLDSLFITQLHYFTLTSYIKRLNNQ